MAQTSYPPKPTTSGRKPPQTNPKGITATRGNNQTGYTKKTIIPAPFTRPVVRPRKSGGH